ncbi:hypothetical protein N6H18_15360 [Reichenbachiella agarivorans]|uniref:Uncharacterized protein n=1 Tax=Reichenbachiella agarivorans TaxID=2979464 RepID=A0ABY6CMJ5_9BACT|nr:hypothetical protein [Reichenbachiella agarivorans]UXP31726.1 hypothetical protein N6H18_15360 [Reichenbachiella agarivorans]
MKTSFLSYYKLILDRVSFSEVLFDKEYKKAIKQLVREDRESLDKWVSNHPVYKRKSELMSA